MKIANWNIERIKHVDKLDVMQALCNDIRADIFVLTESDTRLELNAKRFYHSKSMGNSTVLVGDMPVRYKYTERRVSIFTDYECINNYQTYNNQTALCIELMSPIGSLIVYGVIIGVLGNRHPSFREDLDKIIEDIRRFAKMGKPVCVAGDFNCSFEDTYYYTKYGRDNIKKAFKDAGIQILTENQPECIDHIALTASMVKEKEMIREIVRDEFFLSQKSEQATKADLDVGRDLIDTLSANRERCVGMAANMIGIKKKVIIVSMGIMPLVMFNPVILSKAGPYDTEEGCLSLAGTRKTTRYHTIEVEFFNMEWKKQKMTFSGYGAQIVQHECDHLEGILI